MEGNVMLILYLIWIIRVYGKVKYTDMRETSSGGNNRSKPQWIHLFDFNCYTCKMNEAMYAETLS